MAYRLIYARRCDTRRFNRQWREMFRLSETFKRLDRSVRESGDRMCLLLMADCADECGFPVFAALLRTDGVKVKVPKKRRKRRRSRPRDRCQECGAALVHRVDDRGAERRVSVLCPECDREWLEDDDHY